jgi:hypothetical protein
MPNKLHKIVQYLEEQKTSFAVCRLILASGVNLKAYREDIKDDADALRRVEAALPAILTPEELFELRKSTA